MASLGTHLSWYTRCLRVERALAGEPFSEDGAHERWTRERAQRTAPEAYAVLVDAAFAAALEAAEPAPAPGPADDPAAAVPWLPRWCLVDEAQAAEQPGQSEAEKMTPPPAMLWFGDIPFDLAAVPRRITEALHGHRPEGMPLPFVRKVVQRGYRAEPQAGADGAEKKAAPWLAYAFLVFRDKEEAQQALDHFDGRTVDGDWTVRVRWADARHQPQNKEGRRLARRLLPGQDPPLGERLFPATLHGAELGAAVARHAAASGARLPPGTDAWICAEVAKAAYRRRPRREIPVRGACMPEQLRDSLLEELRRTRWPAAPHRSGMQAEEYLVLHRGKANEGYTALLGLLEELLAWADPTYACTRMAVTKDFQGSPHIDSSDVTFQYVSSLGAFDSGGQLCVEGADPREVFVVDTKDRVARVDGRYTHWVRGHGGGDRYSLLFFCTSPQHATERLRPFHGDFAPAGSDAAAAAAAGSAATGGEETAH